MLFNSLEFLLFFPIVFFVYWALKRNLKAQNVLILIASYFFYGWWDWRFLSLIFFSSITDYFLGLWIGGTEDEAKKSLYLWISVFINIGLLAVFKYFNFFIDSFNDMIGVFGYESTWSSIKIILPIGISFYTFQTLSYTIDVYNEKVEPTKDLVKFLAFVSFFPQLVAGPIERASNLLPQFGLLKKFDFEDAKIGTKQIFWGFFKKVAIADNCAYFSDAIFANYESCSPALLLLGGLLFVFQVYCDFSGYTDIAIGTARLLGYKLLDNFRTPLFSQNMTDFWRRWHISLSTWIRDYLFIPLNLVFRRFGRKSMVIASFIAFTLFGFWHGPSWLMIIWGAIHGLAIILETFFRPKIIGIKKSSPSLLYGFGSWLLTFTFFTVTMIMFRSATIPDFFSYITNMFTGAEAVKTPRQFLGHANFLKLSFLSLNLVVLFILDWINQAKIHSLQHLPKIRYLLYLYLFHEIVKNFFSELSFIYFQF